MGIRGLNKLINQYANKSLSEKNISEFCGSKIAIDSEILMYKYRAGSKEQGTSTNSHIHGFINNVFWYLKHGITPIYVFDGIPNAAKKKNVLSKRYSNKERMFKRVEDLEDTFLEQLTHLENYTQDDTNPLSPEVNETLDQLLKLQRRLSVMTVTKNHKNECRYLLKLMGVPFINANEDAEALCVTLQQTNQVDYVYTEDTDALTYTAAQLTEVPESGPLLLKRGSSIDTVITVDLGILLKELKLTPDSFVDMCIMSGCDFCSSIPRIGPIKSYNYIKKYGDIETFLKETNIQAPEGFNYNEAREIFKKDHSQEISKSLDLGKLNVEDLKKYLSEERKLNPMPIITRYHAHVKFYKKKLTQQTIDSFFKNSSSVDESRCDSFKPVKEC